MADTLSCQRETLHSQQLRSIKKSIDSDHGIYRYLLLWCMSLDVAVRPEGANHQWEEESTRRVVD